ncbi:unnamed protein product [Ceutorhynchus assimilis]|uniref:Myb/SANT-like DNA-binding domain-containing protein n=1 Tax=Ceutorhynchus assimilis TaxID=467358 RepID=A0A9N9MWH9_9CUCU|nr:unnamed protein product [Ceutorhynchus assimilis]
MASTKMISHMQKKKHVWDIIAEKMNSYNYNRSASKIERKWINLLRVYRSIKDNKGPKKTGRGSQNYKFFDDLDEILGDKPSNNNRLCVEVGINRDPTNIGEENSSVDGDHPSTSQHASESYVPSASTSTDNITPSSCKRKRKFSSASQSEQYLLAKMKRHEERMAIEKEKLLLERQKVDLLKFFLENKETKLN